MDLIDPTQQLLEAAMRGSWQRQTALTANIANASTPGYQRKEVDFESQLRDAVATGQSPARLAFAAEAQAPAAGPNGAGVSLDEEAAASAENALDYQALTQVVGARSQIVKAAIGIL